MMKNALRRLASKPNTKIPAWLRGRAEVYAALANVADLSELESSQKVKLVADALKTKVISNLAKQKTVEAKRLFASLNEMEYRPNGWYSPTFILGLTDSSTTFSITVKLMLRNFRNTSADRRKYLYWKISEPAFDTGLKVYVNRFVRISGRLTTSEIFLFRRSPICQTIFVMNGKQKYCDQKCTARAAGPRTDYMRGYMKERRAAIREEKRERLEANRNYLFWSHFRIASLFGSGIFESNSLMRLG
jgi:hypothetical protein